MILENTFTVNENLQRFLECEAEVGVIGGKTLAKESGSFRFNLGSGQKGTFHEIRAIGMDDVTTELANYDLDEIGKEFISTSTYQEKD